MDNPPATRNFMSICKRKGWLDPPVDNPHWFGQLSAANFISDDYCMGEKPRGSRLKPLQEGVIASSRNAPAPIQGDMEQLSGLTCFVASPSRHAHFSFWTLLLLLVLVNGCAKKTPAPVTEEYDKAARERIAQWKTLIQETRNAPISEQLVAVNRFFNRLHFVSDLSHWAQEDYWATPLETVVSNGGDCEDFTIAKYFTLRHLKVPDEKMRLTYVKSLTLNQPHMVLNYYQHPSADPLVLDNLQKRILPASQRKDLIPVYSFNGTGLWLAKYSENGKPARKASRLKRWQDLLQRMEAAPLLP